MIVDQYPDDVNVEDLPRDVLIDLLKYQTDRADRAEKLAGEHFIRLMKIKEEFNKLFPKEKDL